MIPWWQLATALLLGVSFVLALSNGREIGAVIVAVLALPYVIFVVASLLTGRRGS
jgi:choline-glycine betaine transporter